MTTLRTFQDEIEGIHSEAVKKQRNHDVATAAAERNKENKKPASKDTRANNQNASVKEENAAAVVGESDEEAELETILASGNSIDNENARDTIASILTRNKGEFILRLGERPAHNALFAGDTVTKTDSWIGTPRTQEEIKRIRDRASQLAEEVGGMVSMLYPPSKTQPRTALLFRLPPRSVESTPEVRIAVVGNVDSGKSTTLGVLTRGGLDDGRGRARVGLFRHKHEIETGRTSSVGMEILGFAPSGDAILPANSTSVDAEMIRREKLGWEEISVQAAKIISFIDLAGHEKYLKTTLYGLTSGAPSCVMLMVGANAGLIGMSKEHLAISLALNVPVVVCITKIDMTPPNVLAETVKQAVKILTSPGCRKKPVFVKSRECAAEVAQVFATDRLCPIFQVSNVTGEGLDYLRTFLNLLPSSEADSKKFDIDRPLEFSITDVWSVPYVGTVVNGIMNAGQVKAGTPVLFGPDANGVWHSTAIKTIQRKKAPVASADAGQCVSFALKRVKRADVRKGMVIVPKTETPPPATRRFEGQVLILYHNTTLQKGYQAMLHCGAVRQTVRIVAMDNPNGILRTGDRATVEFEFISHPEFIKEGMKLLFREGKTKGLGVITRLL